MLESKKKRYQLVKTFALQFIYTGYTIYTIRDMKTHARPLGRFKGLHKIHSQRIFVDKIIVSMKQLHISGAEVITNADRSSNKNLTKQNTVRTTTTTIDTMEDDSGSTDGCRINSYLYYFRKFKLCSLVAQVKQIIR